MLKYKIIYWCNVYECRLKNITSRSIAEIVDMTAAGGGGGSVMCCHVKSSATGRSLVERSPTELCVCVTECNQMLQ
jgi:hypothetical protein